MKNSIIRRSAVLLLSVPFLSCDEDTYFISIRSANIDTNFYTVDSRSSVSSIASMSISDATISGNYYVGLKSNGNN